MPKDSCLCIRIDLTPVSIEILANMYFFSIDDRTARTITFTESTDRCHLSPQSPQPQPPETAAVNRRPIHNTLSNSIYNSIHKCNPRRQLF